MRSDKTTRENIVFVSSFSALIRITVKWKQARCETSRVHNSFRFCLYHCLPFLYIYIYCGSRKCWNIILQKEEFQLTWKPLISMNICACYYVTQHNDIRYVEQHGRKFVPEDHLGIPPGNIFIKRWTSFFFLYLKLF